MVERLEYEGEEEDEVMGIFIFSKNWAKKLAGDSTNFVRSSQLKLLVQVKTLI